MTENRSADCEVFPQLLNEAPDSVARAYGDGAYDTRGCYEACLNNKIDPVIPPQRNAVYHKDASPALARISHRFSGNPYNLSHHLRPQSPSPCRSDNVLGVLRTNLAQHLACLSSKIGEKCGLDHRNHSVLEIIGLGGDEDARKLWKKLKKYHRRSLSETAMFRFKILFGGDLKSINLKAQRTEVKAKCEALNRMTRLGMPDSEKVVA